MPEINTQPVYTQVTTRTMIGIPDIPLNTNASFNPSSITGLTTTGKIYSLNKHSYVYRIRFVTMGDTVTNTTITAKLLYVFIGNDSITRYALYKTLAIPATTISDTVANPELEMYFPDGLLMPANYGIYVAASTNYSTTALRGDGIWVTVEAGSLE